MSLFKSPKFQSNPAPDPNAIENRRSSERNSRLATGGTQSTLLSKAMAGAAGAPISTLTGIG